jgi:hypothetical protein
MKLRQLQIRRTESYQTPANALVGTVTLVDEGGEQTVTLSSVMLVKICNLLQSHVAQRAQEQALQAGKAMQEAAAEIELAGNPFLASDE